MSASLSEFQDAFVSALYQDDHMPPLGVTRQAAFEVYRNTVIKGSVDALIANFPTVERLVGEEWLRAAATTYTKQSPPSDPRLLFYGADFPDFLDTFEHARTMPYLGDVARLDLLWIDVHSAAETPGFDIKTFLNLNEGALLNMRLKPNTTARWIWFPRHPAYTLWRVNRAQLELPQNLPWQGEGALLTRSAGQITWLPLGIGGCTFLEGCAADMTLGRAAELALDHEPDLDLNHLLDRLITANTFAVTEFNQ